jgi:hypothetical protein
MNLPRLSSVRNAAVLSLWMALAAMTAAPVACSSSNSPGGTGGSTGSGGSGNGGANGTGGSGATDAGADVRASGSGGRTGDAGTDVRGTGGMIVLVDAAGNAFTCADLLACCNAAPAGQARTLCLGLYNNDLPRGDMACGADVVQIRNNGGNCP